MRFVCILRKAQRHHRTTGLSWPGRTVMTQPVKDERSIPTSSARDATRCLVGGRANVREYCLRIDGIRSMFFRRHQHLKPIVSNPMSADHRRLPSYPYKLFVPTSTSPLMHCSPIRCPKTTSLLSCRDCLLLQIVPKDPTWLLALRRTDESSERDRENGLVCVDVLKHHRRVTMECRGTIC